MTNQQPPDIIEIGGVKYQRIVEKKPQTLYDALLDDFDIQDCEIICNMVDNWISQRNCDYVGCANYLQGYNALMKTLKENLK